MRADKFPIGIIGGTGGMGKWFASFFRQEGYSVQISGRNTGLAPRQMAEVCPVVIVSVPIAATDAVIREVGPCMPHDSLLMDLTSLKEAPVRAMLEVSVSEVIGLHPLFGPRVASLDGQNIAVCPGRGERWLPWLKDIMEKNGAHLVEATPEGHDKMMALVQGLNHFNTVVLGLTMAESGVSPEELRRFSTPALRERLDHLGRIFAHPDLYAHLIADNPHTDKFLSLYGKNLDELRGLLHSGDMAAVTKMIKSMNIL
ncbi:MAG TPA: prephenate dehydrogenase/arogenate dehydrogenase family protein [Syntrophus sp. (in: bacteria)]|nr:prephenate dehydrogenase/arogenate dehydrogenase family protein [Syntrophus sp. (in: bacteria)]